MTQAQFKFVRLETTKSNGRVAVFALLPERYESGAFRMNGSQIATRIASEVECKLDPEVTKANLLVLRQAAAMIREFTS